MKKNLKIAMIGQKGIPAVYGGVERHVEEISLRLAEKGHEVTVYCRPYYMAENKFNGLNLNGVKLKVLPTVKTKHLDAIAHCFISSLHSLFQGYDIVHYHAIGPSTLSFIPRVFGAKTLVTVHGLDWQRKKWNRFASLFLKFGEATAYFFPNATISVSKTHKDYYDEKYSTSINYIPNGVNMPEIILPDIIKDKYGLEKGSYIVFISRLVPEKGCHYLIEAYKRVKTDKKLVIVGGSSHSDTYVEELKRMAKEDSRIIFTGSVFGKELAEYFSNAYFFVLPSEMEGLPIVILEALSYGKCVLSSDIPENIEVIRPSNSVHNGYSFISQDIDNLEIKLRFLIDNPDNVESMSEQSKQYVNTNYNWDIITSQTEELYCSLIK